MSSIQKLRRKKLSNQELTAEEVVLQDLFYDLYRHRGSIYRVNFMRGIFFGLGTFLGGTIVVALVILLLSWLMSLAPGSFHDFFQWIIRVLEHHPAG